MQLWVLRTLVDARGLVIFDRLWHWEADDPDVLRATVWAASAATGGIRPMTLRAGEVPQTRSAAWLGAEDAPYYLSDVDAFTWGETRYLLLSRGTSGAVTLMRDIGSARLETLWTLQDGGNRPLSLTHLLVIEHDSSLLLIGATPTDTPTLALYDWGTDM